MNVNRRLIQYARLYSKSILIALVMLALAVGTELSGPFIAKSLIDKHILGVEQTWYETSQVDHHAVSYQGHWLKRGDYFESTETKGNPATVLQAGQNFYFVDQSLPFHENPTIKDGYITVTRNGREQESLTVPAMKLTKEELFAFYKPEVPYMWELALLYFILLMMASVLTYGQHYLLEITANRILQTMRQDVFHQIHRLPIHYFDHMPAGKVVSRITNDTEAIRDFYVTVLATIFSSVMTMVGIYVALLILDVRFALICFLLIPLLILWVTFYRRYAVSINQRIRVLLGDINAMVNETIQGISIIRIFNRQRKTVEEFESLNQQYFNSQMKLLRINSATGYNLVGTLRNLFLITLIAYFGYQSLGLAGAISFGSLYAFVDYLGRLFQPVFQFVGQLSNLEQARVSAKRVFELLDEPGENIVGGKIDRYRGDVVFEDVFFSYDGKKDVLKGISFQAKQGQTVALVGHTGSGKSTIMNLLFRFYDPRAGRITIDGMDITEIPRQHLRKYMGIVLQDPYLFTGTIASNVSLGDPSISRERIDQSLRDVGADRLLHHLPKGWDEPVLEKGNTLSAGQRQLISFARALAFDPAILVLDEATSSIDTETEAVIQEALEVLKRGRTTLIIAHRLSTVRHSDQILVLDRGVIVERGTHEELIGLQGKYYQMYQLQQGQAKISI
ncbi:MAG TPA: ABC transporter ATP-binding protein [Bacillota bacterium]|nr:ABC transporter ATP-binding protein [Bacillota bacterium]